MALICLPACLPGGTADLHCLPSACLRERHYADEALTTAGFLLEMYHASLVHRWAGLAASWHSSCHHLCTPVNLAPQPLPFPGTGTARALTHVSAPEY
jgi:hypothetical protein